MIIFSKGKEEEKAHNIRKRFQTYIHVCKTRIPEACKCYVLRLQLGSSDVIDIPCMANQ
jgi:hypothetical protein